MAKRELIDRTRLLTENMKSKYYHLANGDIAIPIIDIEHSHTITEQEIVKPYLEKLKEQIVKSADNQLKIAMGIADLNERYTHIRVESAFRQCVTMIDNLLSESEDKYGNDDN